MDFVFGLLVGIAGTILVKKILPTVKKEEATIVADVTKVETKVKDELKKI